MADAFTTSELPCPDTEFILEFARGALEPEHARGIEQHLDRCPICATLVGEAAGLSMADAPVPTLDPDATVETQRPPMVSDARLPSGTAIGHYIVLSPLGAGGMGTVYAAHDCQLDRDVALKIIHGELGRTPAARADARARLLREARAMAKLHHPHVVPVHDVGTFDDLPFLAMERIKGGTLATWLAAAPRSWQRIRDVFVLAGEALVAAHAAGLVHRDFKPSNVLVDPFDRVFVADFGLARELTNEAEPASSLRDTEEPDASRDVRPSAPSYRTEAGWVLGTPAYMAPEQFRGRDVDARADQFSFCVALHEALHGQLPEVVRQRPHVGARRQPTPEVDPARPDAPQASGCIPAWLDRVVERGLSVDPADRFDSMERLLHALVHDRRRAHATRKLVLVLALATPVLTALLWWGLRPRPTAEQHAQLARLEREAQTQADAGLYIYPPPNAPTQPTAYSAVMEMESMDAAIDEIAEAKAHALRLEFAHELVSDADALWERPGGRVFAIDAYAAALVFDPEQPRARERAGLTIGELARLRQQAEALSFTIAELEAAQTLGRVREAETHPADLWTELAARERPLILAAGLAALIGGEPQAPGAPARASGGPVTRSDATQPPPPPGTQTSSETDTETDGAAAGRPSQSPAADSARPSPRDPAGARASIRRARTALAAARLDEAEGGFMRALAADPRAAEAHAGLAEVEFERGAYGRAVAHAQRAVTLAPKRASHHLLLGDAMQKVHRYDEARSQYREAAALGSATGEQRARRLDQKLGPSG